MGSVPGGGGGEGGREEAVLRPRRAKERRRRRAIQISEQRRRGASERLSCLVVRSSSLRRLHFPPLLSRWLPCHLRSRFPPKPHSPAPLPFKNVELSSFARAVQQPNSSVSLPTFGLCGLHIGSKACRWAPSVLSLPGIVRGAIEHALHCAFRGSCTGMAIGH